MKYCSQIVRNDRFLPPDDRDRYLHTAVRIFTRNCVKKCAKVGWKIMPFLTTICLMHRTVICTLIELTYRRGIRTKTAFLFLTDPSIRFIFFPYYYRLFKYTRIECEIVTFVVRFGFSKIVQQRYGI